MSTIWNRTTTLAMTGLVLGVAGLAYLQEPSQAAEQPVQMERVVVQEPVAEEPSEEEVEPEGLRVEVSPSKAFGRNGVYAWFEVSAPPEMSVESVRLVVDPGPGVGVEDVFGYDWSERGGASVELGSLRGGESVGVAVELGLDDPGAGSVAAYLSHTEEGKSVTGMSAEYEVASQIHDDEVELLVREVLSQRTIDRAGELRKAGELGDAIAVVVGARSENDQVGRMLRIGRQLAPWQERLRRLESELEREKNKPKPKPVRKKVKKIEIVRGI